MTENWEYLTTIVAANIERRGALELIKKRWPNYQPKKHAPEALMATLNSYGEDGWELIHIEPVTVQKDKEVYIPSLPGGSTSDYFCVFKRKVGS